MALLTFIECLESLVCEMFDRCSDVEYEFALKSIVEIVLALSDQIDHLVVLWDSRNAPSTSPFPPIMLSALASVSTRNVYNLRNVQKELLSYLSSTTEHTEIGDCLKPLARKLRSSKSSGGEQVQTIEFEMIEKE